MFPGLSCSTGEVPASSAEIGADSVYAGSSELGTGDAVAAARNELAQANSSVLILSGDVPLVRAETLRELIKKHRSETAACTILTVRLENPTGYGRVARDEAGGFLKIVEQKDASDDERQIREVNAGIYCFDGGKLFEAIARVQPTNSQGEYYLTDVPGILSGAQEKVTLYQHHDAREVSGVEVEA